MLQAGGPLLVARPAWLVALLAAGEAGQWYCHTLL